MLYKKKERRCTRKQKSVAPSANEIVKLLGTEGPFWPPGSPPRDRIFETACYLFYHLGLHNVSVEAIASLADTNKMTLYRHFRSKDALIAAYLRHFAEEGMKRWAEIGAKYPGDPKSHLLEWIASSEEECEERFNRGSAFVKATAELPDLSHPGRMVIEEYKERFNNMVKNACINAELLQPVELSEEILILFEGAVVCWDRLGGQKAYHLFAKLARMAIDSHDPTLLQSRP